MDREHLERVVALALVEWWNRITPTLLRSEPDSDELSQAQVVADALIHAGLVEGTDT